MFPHSEFIDAGASFRRGTTLSELFRPAAYLVDKILKGAKPADLTVKQPTKFELDQKGSSPLLAIDTRFTGLFLSEDGIRRVFNEKGWGSTIGICR